MSASTVTLLPPARVAVLKTPYVTRRIPRSAMATLLTDGVVPRVGDLVLARVDRLGQQRLLELGSGRRALLAAGDPVVLVYGNRCAANRMEATVPEDLGACDLVAAGGVAARARSRQANATTVRPLGLVGDRDGRVLNLADFALGMPAADTRHAFTVAVVGTSMNAGRTETVAGTIRGLARAGLKVGAAKVTGTGAGADAWSMSDAGAAMVLDMSDAGLPSTYLADAAKVEEVMHTLTRHLYRAGCEAVVFEVADGLFQRETADLLRSPGFSGIVDAVVFAAGDSLGTAAGVRWLHEQRLPVAVASGMVAASPLERQEARAATGLPVLGLDDLSSPLVGEVLGMHRAARRQSVAAPIL